MGSFSYFNRDLFPNIIEFNIYFFDSNFPEVLWKGSRVSIVYYVGGSIKVETGTSSSRKRVIDRLFS